ncbi:substrate-binding domain-containing protein [Rhodococcus sp. 24CO]|uniref:substrate-binding domain-containing protein n=1 Tax=Rhodococcus sp. 24CO TaxID=3117460 RepID=UPI003D330737
MGEHRGGSGARGISKGPILVVVAVVLIVAGFFGWKALGNRIDDQGQQAAGTCVEGNRTLDITVDPSIAPQIEQLAKRFTDTSPVIRDHCITTAINAVPSTLIVNALAAGTEWDSTALGPRPNLWIPVSSFELAPLSGKAVINGEPRSIANSPVVLAVAPETATALESANAGWQSLGETTLALPVGSPQTVMATQAIAAAGAGSGPVTLEQAQSSPVTSALSALASQFQSLPTPPDTTADALAALTSGATDTVTAVPAVEQSIAQSANADMTAFSPSGAAPLADYPAVIVAGGGIDETASRAAAQFSEFIRDAEQSQIFVDAGFRVEGKSVPDLGALEPAKIESTLTPASAETTAALNAVVANPVSVRSATILMDTSTSMSTNLSAAGAAIESQLLRSPDASDVGLHAFPGSSAAAAERVIVAGAPLDADQRTKLTAAMSSLSAEGKTSKYPALAAAYKDAATGYDANRTNSVLLVTSAATDESTMTRAELLSAIASATDPARPVRVDVLVIGPSGDAATLQDVSDRTGGTLIRVNPDDSAAMSAAVAELLS